MYLKVDLELIVEPEKKILQFINSNLHGMLYKLNYHLNIICQ